MYLTLISSCYGQSININGKIIDYETDLPLAYATIELFSLHTGTIADENVDFDYKLKPGKLKNRNAMRILQINDYPDSVINEAIEMSKTLDGLNKSQHN